MKKSLIALAALASVAGVAQAQSSVSIYGVLDASESYVKSSGSAHAAAAFNDATTATSRLGFKGTEDLGSGLKANFVLEEQIALTSGATGSTTSGAGAGTFNRAANVGLESNKFGTLTLGRQAAPIYAAAAGNDAFGINSLGFLNAYVQTHVLSSANKLTGQSTTAIGGAVDTGPKAPNLYAAGVGFATPVWNGLQAKVFTTPGSGTQASSDQNANAVKQVLVSYEAYGLKLTAATGSMVGAAGASGQTEQLYMANYTYGPVKATVGLNQIRYAAGIAENNVDNTTAGLTYAYNSKTTLGVEWTESKDKTNGANKSSTLGLMASYSLSPRTNVYALAGFTDNKGAANISPIYSSVGGTTAAKTTDAYSVGIKHTF